MATRFASAETERLPLSEGDWIEVKAELSVGDMRRMHGYSVKSVEQRDREVVYQLDAEKLPAARALAYLVDWSFRDAEGHKVKVSESSLAALTPEAAQEIDAVLLAFEASQQEKKRRGTSGSPAAPDPTS